MISIRLRMILILALTAGFSGMFARNVFSSYFDMRSLYEEKEASFQLIEEMSEIKNREGLKILSSYLPKIRTPRRQEEFKKLLESVDKEHARQTQERKRVFEKNEREFRKHLLKQIAYHDEKTQYYAVLTLSVMAIGLVTLLLFTQAFVIRPLRGLSRKMVDFLNDRYTYQFSVPTMDEIGKMQSTFNSLAQRVISNMDQLKTLDQAKSEFLNITSHELRTPLTSIKGSLSLMRSGVVGAMNEMAENLLTIAETETDRLIRLINDFLDLAKIEAAKLGLNKNWHNVGELVALTVKSLAPLAKQAQVTLTQESNIKVEANIDRDRIQQVITNLVSNAIKFSPPEKSVQVRARISDKQELIIEIQDSGRGIHPQDQEAIFQKFRQATSDSNPLVKGTGLGLAIARALVEEHGGQIGLESSPGVGSVFYFTLPDWRHVRTSVKEDLAA